MNTSQSADRLAARPSRPRMIHDVAPPKWAPRRASVTPATTPEQPVTSPSPVARQQRSRGARRAVLMKWLKRYGLIVATLIAVIVIVRLSASPGVGGTVIAAYAIGMLLLRIPSSVTFGLAALALVGVAIELTLLPEPGRANSGALLVFLLLGVGLVSTVLETRRLESKIRLSRRR